ncbi:hypothetical protein LCGC14_0305870 [marine sediment metagenome]|uniref:Uncharacterized protein n=1 Tax=marine sediment metagenome TaxID=412755 RepID=A0A0F9WV52_9ZZZZ
MDYTVEIIRGDTVVINNHKVEKLKIDDVIIIKVPLDSPGSEMENFLIQIKIAFPDKTVVITKEDVKFCRLREKNAR